MPILPPFCQLFGLAPNVPSRQRPNGNGKTDTAELLLVSTGRIPTSLLSTSSVAWTRIAVQRCLLEGAVETYWNIASQIMLLSNVQWGRFGTQRALTIASEDRLLVVCRCPWRPSKSGTSAFAETRSPSLLCSPPSGSFMRASLASGRQAKTRKYRPMVVMFRM